MNSALMFSKASDEWRTPQAFFEALDAEFGFDADMAASAENCWKENYWGPDHHRVDRRNSLVFDWPPVCWLNPPYSQCRAFIAKAAEQARRGSVVVCLIPARTDTRMWHESIWDGERHAPQRGVEIRFIKGRLKFGGGTNSAPFPSAVIVFRPDGPHAG
jgi:phage N-6-adenine-methyltransferase